MRLALEHELGARLLEFSLLAGEYLARLPIGLAEGLDLELKLLTREALALGQFLGVLDLLFELLDLLGRPWLDLGACSLQLALDSLQLLARLGGRLLALRPGLGSDRVGVEGRTLLGGAGRLELLTRGRRDPLGP